MPAAFITNIKRPYDPCKKISFQSTIENYDKVVMDRYNRPGFANTNSPLESFNSFKK